MTHIMVVRLNKEGGECSRILLHLQRDGRDPVSMTVWLDPLVAGRLEEDICKACMAEGQFMAGPLPCAFTVKSSDLERDDATLF